jgi:hypothetical protein
VLTALLNGARAETLVDSLHLRSVTLDREVGPDPNVPRPEHHQPRDGRERDHQHDPGEEPKGPPPGESPDSAPPDRVDVGACAGASSRLLGP